MEEVIFRLKGYDGEYFCLKGWPLNYGENGAGGIDIEASLSLNMGYFQITDAPLILSTDLLEKWLKGLTKSYLTLVGQNNYHSYYGDLRCQVTMKTGGKIIICGIYRELFSAFSSLRFEMASDQTFLATAIKDLETFLSHISD